MHPKESVLHSSLTPHSTSPISCQNVSNAAYASRIKKDSPLAPKTCYLEEKKKKKGRGGIKRKGKRKIPEAQGKKKSNTNIKLASPGERQ